MEIIKADYQNIDNIMQIINDAKLYFKENNIDQWQNGYPNNHTIENDINNGHGYIVKIDDDIIAYFALSYDNEATYNIIYDGSWHNDHHHAIIHRICINKKFKSKGLSKAIMSMIEDIIKTNGYDTIRIDTHQDNIVMQALLNKLTYKYCGIIYLEDNSPRLAYDKKLMI